MPPPFDRADRRVTQTSEQPVGFTVTITVSTLLWDMIRCSAESILSKYVG